MGERKGTILEAAFRVFAERGYHGATTRELARAAGVSEVTLFRHFRSKEQIFREAVARHSPLARAEDLPLRGAPPQEGLAATGVFAFRLLLANQATLRILLGEAVRHPEVGQAVFREVSRKVLAPLSRRIVEWQREGALRKGPPRLLARAFLGMFFYYFLTEVFLLRRPFPPARQARVAREFVSTFLEGTTR